VGIGQGFGGFPGSTGHQIYTTHRRGRLVLAIVAALVAIAVVELLAEEVVPLPGSGLDLQLAELSLARTVVGHLVHALLVRVVLTVAALQSLLEESLQQLLAQLAHRGYSVCVHHEGVRNTEHHRSVPAAR